MFAFAITAMIAYSLSLSLIVPTLAHKKASYRRAALYLAIIALLCHGIALQKHIFHVSTGLNLSLLNVGSVVSLIMSTVMTIAAACKRGWILLPVVYSFALINLALCCFVPSEFITHLESSPTLLFHIGMSLFAYATLIIAALYALQLSWLDHCLKSKKITFTADMPPLMSLERKMFHITQVGTILLTITLCTGLIYLNNLFSPENIHKTVLSITAWFVYILLLWGHYREGWRGRCIVWLNLIGTLLLTLAYFGNRILLEIYLQ